MKQEVIITGSGGQGVLLAGTLLAQAAIEENKSATWIPSYGAEKRGGLSYCFVTVSDKPISSPIVAHPGALLALDKIGLQAYENDLKKTGLMIINSSLIPEGTRRKDVEVISVPASSMASELGSSKITNMVGLGVYLSKSKVVSLDSVFKALEKVIAKRHHALIPKNKEAIKRGYEFK